MGIKNYDVGIYLPLEAGGLQRWEQSVALILKDVPIRLIRFKLNLILMKNDYFDIDYVSHEIGHQFGANHTFSHRDEGTGVNAEPGSGFYHNGLCGHYRS